MTACSSNNESAQNQSAIYQSLLTAENGFAASQIIRDSTFQTCADLVAVVMALDQRVKTKNGFPASVVEGLVEETLERSRPNCSAAQALQRLQSTKGKREVAVYTASLLEPDPARALQWLEVHRVDEHRGDEHRGDEHRGDEHRGDEHRGDEHRGDEHRGESVLLLRRRAELQFRLGKPTEGRNSLVAALRQTDDDTERARVARLYLVAGEPETSLSLCSENKSSLCRAERIGAYASLGRYQEVGREIQASEVHLRRELSEYALTFASDAMALLAANPNLSQLVIAAAYGCSKSENKRRVELFARAVLLEPKDADLRMELAEGWTELGDIPMAIAEWDAASQLVAGRLRPLLAPIRLLAESGKQKEALARATSLRSAAKTAEAFHLASLAYKYAGDTSIAVKLARLAAKQRGDGRLQSELASRLEENGQPKVAAEILRTLLVCGIHGRPWHRHEVVARLVKLIGNENLKSVINDVECQPVEAIQLKEMLNSP